MNKIKQIDVYGKIIRYSEIIDNMVLLDLIKDYVKIEDKVMPLRVKIDEIINNCKHKVKSREYWSKYKKKEVEYWGSGWCMKCGVDTGWYCPKSQSHICKYKKYDECCIYCGNPSERK